MTGPPTRPASAPEPADAGDRAGAFDRLGRRLLVPAVLALLALVGLALYGDLREIRAELLAFDAGILVPVLGLSLVNYALRFLRWQMYLRELDVRLTPMRSLGVFLVGFVLSITPGKAGELGKAWLVRELGGGPAHRAVPAVVAERVTDLLGILLLVALGASVLPEARWIGLGVFLVSALSVALLAWRPAAERALDGLERLPGIRHRVHLVRDVYDRFRGLLRPAPLTAALGLSIVAWGAEGAGLHLVLGSAGEAGILGSVFDYALSTLAGAVSLLPGGLLASEASLAALLDLRGLEPAAAAAATLVIRAATLWFAVALGLAALPWVLAALRSRPRRRVSDAVSTDPE